jgi:hypothetical protein
MKCYFFLFALLTWGFFAIESKADSNATGGSVLASQSLSLGAGPFNHDNPIGTSGSLNSVVNISFTGGFIANHVRLAGTLNKVAAADFPSENGIRISRTETQFYNWTNPGPASSTWGPTFNYDSTQSITGVFTDGIDPNGNWTVTFFNSFEDDTSSGQIDSFSSNVTMEFRRIDPIADSNGVFSLGTLSLGGQYNRVGEFAVAQPSGANGNNDRYNFSVAVSGLLSAETFGTNVFTGNVNGDTEIGIFNAANGAIVTGAFDDDNGPGLYSRLQDVFLTAGDYVFVIGDFDTNFSNTSTLSNLSFGSAATPYDYGLTMNFTAVPEPSTLFLLSVTTLGFAGRRCRRLMLWSMP